MSTADFVFVPDSEAGAAGVVTVPARTKIMRYRPRVRTAVVISCVTLGAAFVTVSSPFGVQLLHVSAADVATASAAASLASFVCAFLLSSRLAISRSPALAALAATFAYSGMLFAAQAWPSNFRSGWLWIACALGCAFGVTIFGAIDWYWALRQRRSAERGYYSDTRPRYKRLPQKKASAALVWSIGFAVASGAIVVWSASRIAAPAGTGYAAWAAWTVIAYAAAAVTLIFAPGHRTILRDWMIAAVIAGALSAATVAVNVGGSEASAVAAAYALLAALIPAAVLLCDAKIDMYVVDRQAEEIHELALVNDLTGLGTARAFGIHLERAIALADATQIGFDVAMFDVAGMQAANRAAGCHVGNELLVSASRVIRSALQPAEFAARVKGDEFAALLMPGDGHAHNELRERVTRALNSPGPRHERLRLALHIGVHRYDPHAPQSAESFMSEGWQRLRAEKTSVDTVRQL